MTKTQSIKKFQPFFHENLDIKNELLQLARNAKTGEKKLETDLASVLIYSNIAEYLAEHLLSTLNHFIHQVSYTNYAAILYVNSVFKSGRKMTLNQTVEEIEKFQFPDKENILKNLKNIAESRNRLFHNFAKSNLSEIQNLLATDLPIIQNECEEVITRINTVYAGLQKILLPQQSNSPVQK